MSNAKTQFEMIKFLVERAHVEATLFWQRNNFMFLTNTALLGTAFINFYLKAPTPKPQSEYKLAMAISGLIITSVWLIFNKVGKRMNHAYMKDAKKISSSNKELSQVFQYSLGDKIPSSEKGQKRFLAATTLNYFFIAGFGVAWICVLFTPF